MKNIKQFKTYFFLIFSLFFSVEFILAFDVSATDALASKKAAVTGFDVFVTDTLTYRKAVASLPEWTVVVYVQANNNLGKYAIKNFEDMASIGSNDKLKLLVQWYDPNHKGIWRYRIDKGKMELDVHLPSNSDGNKAKDLISCVQWAANNYAARKYFIVLWNHGVGILDPIWGGSRFTVNENVLYQSPKIQIAGLTIKSFDFHSILESFGEEQRGILFNEMTRTYMTNQELTSALSEIKNSVLKKKIDLLGMDACLMAMLEIGYQVKDYADYFVASEEVELASGWPYGIFLRPLSKGGISSLSLARNIVSTYESLYKSKVAFYTQSAIDLSKVSAVKENLDVVVKCIRSCKERDDKFIKRLIRKARGACLHFSTPSYIDLHSFYTELQKGIEEEIKISNAKQNYPRKNSIENLKNLRLVLEAGKSLIEDVVVANSVGSATDRAKGVSIYYPNGRIDNSYQKTDFARDGLWFDFLREYMAN